jgi:hypothetical protein
VCPVSGTLRLVLVMANVKNVYVAVPSAVCTQESGSCKYAPTGYGESISIPECTVSDYCHLLQDSFTWKEVLSAETQQCYAHTEMSSVRV